MEMGGGIRLYSYQTIQTIERQLLGMRLAKTDVDVDGSVLGIGGALIVDLVVGFKG
jgi:hypothetical protein